MRGRVAFAKDSHRTYSILSIVPSASTSHISTTLPPSSLPPPTKMGIQRPLDRSPPPPLSPHPCALPSLPSFFIKISIKRDSSPHHVVLRVQLYRHHRVPHNKLPHQHQHQHRLNANEPLLPTLHPILLEGRPFLMIRILPPPPTLKARLMSIQRTQQIIHQRHQEKEKRQEEGPLDVLARDPIPPCGRTVT